MRGNPKKSNGGAKEEYSSVPILPPGAIVSSDTTSDFGVERGSASSISNGEGNRENGSRTGSDDSSGDGGNRARSGKDSSIESNRSSKGNNVMKVNIKPSPDSPASGSERKEGFGGDCVEKESIWSVWYYHDHEPDYPMHPPHKGLVCVFV